MNQYPNGPQQPYGQPPAQPGPYTQYPPQGQPGYPPPGYPQQPPMQQQAPKKKKNKLAIGCGSVIALVVLIAIISAVNSGGKGSTTPTAPSSSGSGNTTNSAPAAPQTWTTTHTFTGTGAKKTETFAVSDDWKITWNCQGTDGIDAPLYVIVYNSDGSMADPSAVSTTCKAAGPATTDTSEEHQGGNVYLDVNTGISWNLTIQELK